MTFYGLHDVLDIFYGLWRLKCEHRRKSENEYLRRYSKVYYKVKKER